MEVKKRRASQRSMAARERWSRHVSAQRSSGCSQAAYCREAGLDPRYFSLWKSKLGREARSGEAVGACAAAPALVPVRIRRTPVRGAQVAPEDSALRLTVRLPNGVAVELLAGSMQRVAGLLDELARVAC